MSELWQPGAVIEIDHNRAWVKLKPASGCERCLSGRGCGAGVFSRLFARHAVTVPLVNQIHASPGQRVLVGVSASALMGAAIRLYGLPVLAFVVGALLVAWSLPAHTLATPTADGMVLAGGVVLAALCFGLFARKPLSNIKPQMRECSYQGTPSHNDDLMAGPPA